MKMFQTLNKEYFIPYHVHCIFMYASGDLLPKHSSKLIQFP